MALLVWCLLGAVVGFIAKEKNRNSTLWAVMGVLFGVFALFTIVVLPPLVQPPM